MTDRPLGDSELDAAIDRAVRDLMGAEPRADLRERVLSELAGASARAVLWPRFAFALVAATAAIVIAVQFVERPAERPVEPTVAGLPALPDRPRTARQPPFGHSENHNSKPPRTLVRTTGPVPFRGVTPDDRPIQAASIATVEAMGIEPVTPVERLGPIAPLDLPPVFTSEISLEPLTLERIEMTLLTPQR